MTYDPTHRYLVFAWVGYEASGGWGDLLGSASTLEEAREMAQGWESDDLYELVDRMTGSVVEYGERDYDYLNRKRRSWKVTTS